VPDLTTAARIANKLTQHFDTAAACPIDQIISAVHAVTAPGNVGTVVVAKSPDAQADQRRIDVLLRACVLRLCASGVQRLQLKVMTSIRRSEVALRASAGLLVLMVGWGAVGAGASALAPDTTAANAMFSGKAPASLLAPNGPSCIIGLNCGCIGSCGPVPHHHRAPANDHPPDASPAPRPGPSGG
jgi:hypothetical protein